MQMNISIENNVIYSRKKKNNKKNRQHSDRPVFDVGTVGENSITNTVTYPAFSGCFINFSH